MQSHNVLYGDMHVGTTSIHIIPYLISSFHASILKIKNKTIFLNGHFHDISKLSIVENLQRIVNVSAFAAVLLRCSFVWDRVRHHWTVLKQQSGLICKG
jgi:hypothetical protein